MSEKFTVYMHVNKINGKRYVGITSQNPVERWQNGKGYHKNKHFSDAIKKYGWGAFDHMILFCTDKDTACNIEQWLIAEYKTTDKHFGYNLTSGGEHFKHSKESKKLISQRRKGIKPPPFTEQHKLKLKKNHSGGTDKRPVFCVEQNKTYASINDAARATGINKKGISGCCRCVDHYNTAGGYHWKFA
jgi:hypothetical protein